MAGRHFANRHDLQTPTLLHQIPTETAAIARQVRGSIQAHNASHLMPKQSVHCKLQSNENPVVFADQGMDAYHQHTRFRSAVLGN